MQKSNTYAWISNVGFGAGALALGAGTLLLLTGGEKWERFVLPNGAPAPAPTSGRGGGRDAARRVVFAVAPVREGGVGLLSGDF
jgi:hypothetical protein